MKFVAKVLNSSGSVIVITLDAFDATEAKHVIESSDGRVICLHAPNADRWSPRLNFAKNRFNLIVFNQQLLTLLDAGLPIREAVQVLSRNDLNNTHKAIYDALLNALSQGKQLSAAMDRQPSIFPKLYVTMVEASETTGTVGETIFRYILYQTQADDFRTKVNSAAIYPAILSTVGFLVTGFLLLYVAPRFSAVFDDIRSTKAGAAGLLQIWGTFVRNYWYVAWATFAAVLLGMILIVFHPRVRGFVSQILIKSSLVGARIRAIQLARLYRTLSMLLKSGLSLVVAMRMTEPSLPIPMRIATANALRLISEGKSMSSAMQQQLLSNEVAHKLMVAGESSGNLGEMLEKIADFFDHETSIWFDKASRLIEPILMVVIGLIIGTVVTLLYSPIFDLANAI